MKNNRFSHFLVGSILIISLSATGTNDSTLRVSLNNRKLTSLPKDINYRYLKQLDVSYNQVQVFPDEIASAYNLEDLDISNNISLNLPAFAAQVKQLHLSRLSANGCNLMYLPLEFGKLKRLKYLSLINNHISLISEDYMLNPGLNYLDLSENAIRVLPENFGEWTSLQYLNLSGNPCLRSREVYQTLLKLSNLEELVLRGAGWCDQSVFFLPKLKHLDISNGAFENLEIDSKRTTTLEKLTVDNCNSLDFTSLSPLLSENSIKEIALGGNRFKGFNDVQLSLNLEKMTLSGSELIAFKVKNDLHYLQSLELKFATITCFPEIMSRLARMEQLKHLNISACGITTLPPGFARLEALETLNLSMNKFENVAALFSLKNLKELNVSGCELDSKQLERLKEHLPNTIITNGLSPKINLPGVEKSREGFSLDPSVSSTLTTSNGTEIYIPSRSLIYADGKPVTEKVTIKYNSFYSLASIAASGIHMNYSVNGELQPFRSAGMFELTAIAGDKQVQLRPGKKIGIKFQSLDSTNSYNYYKYDSIKQTWEETGKDSITKLRSSKKDRSEKSDSISSLAQRTAFDFVLPKVSQFYLQQGINLYFKGLNKEKNLTFRINTPLDRKKIMCDTDVAANYLYEIQELNTSAITWVVDEPDLKTFAQTIFEKNEVFAKANGPLQGKQKRNKEEMTIAIRWIGDINSGFELIPDREKDNFLFRFSNEKDTLEFHAYPDINERSVARAQKRIKKIYDRYLATREERMIVSDARKRKFKRQYDLYAANIEAQRKKMREMSLSSLNMTGAMGSNWQDNGVPRFLSIAGFGYHNCDHPLEVNDPLILAANFVDENKKEINTSIGCSPVFVDVKSNICIAYSSISNRLPSGTMLTVVVSDKGKLYLGKYSTFDKRGEIGREDIKLAEVPAGFTFSDFEKYIASNL